MAEETSPKQETTSRGRPKTRVGIVTSDRLRRARRYTILAIAIFSAVATPGGDLVSPTVLGVTLYVLFEITTFVIRRSGR